MKDSTFSALDDEPPPPYTPGDFYDHPYPPTTTTPTLQNVRHHGTISSRHTQATDTVWDSPTPAPPNSTQPLQQVEAPQQPQQPSQARLQNADQPLHQPATVDDAGGGGGFVRPPQPPTTQTGVTGTECIINDLQWCNEEDSEAALSGAMGGMHL